MDELNNLLKVDNLELPIEKQFEIRKFEDLIKNANREQALEIALKVFKLMIYREYTVNNMLKKQWTGSNIL